MELKRGKRHDHGIVRNNMSLWQPAVKGHLFFVSAARCLNNIVDYKPMRY